MERSERGVRVPVERGEGEEARGTGGCESAEVKLGAGSGNAWERKNLLGRVDLW